MGETMKRGNPETLTPELQAERDALAAMPENEIDSTGMPPVTDWNNAVRGPFRLRYHAPGTTLPACP